MKHSGFLWKGLVAVSASLLSLTLSFAIANAIPVNAEYGGGEVLPENTAEYTFENDAKNPWDYDLATNMWTNTRNSTSATKLTIKVTQAGKVAFEYRMNGVDNNTPGSTRYAFKLSDFYVTLKQGTITNTIVAEHGIAMPDFERLELDNLSANDEIVFSYKRAASNGEEDNLYIRGLNTPNVEPIEVKLTANEGGQISFGQQESASFTENIEFGSPVAFEAIPDETHIFAYWSDKSGNVLSYEPKISIALLSAIDYTANFYQKDGETKITMGTGWEQVTRAPDNPTSYEGYKITQAALGQRTRLIFEAVGDQYLTLKYAFLLNYDEAKYASNKITGYYNGDDYVNISGGNILSLTRFSSGKSASADELTWNDDFHFHLAGEGYHRLELEFDGTGYSTANDIFAIKDIEWTTQPETVTFQLDYDDALGTVYMDEVAMQPGSHSVIKGQYVCFSASFKDVTSKIDPDQKASVRFGGFYTQEQERLWPDPQSCYIKFSDNSISCSNTKTTSTNLYIKANFEEIAVLPEASVTVTSGSDFQEAVTVKSGDTVVLPYGKENSVSFMLEDFVSIEEKYTVSIDGEAQSDLQIMNEAGKNFFRLEKIDSNKTVTVQYTADGYFESPIFTLYLVVTNEDDISEHLLVDGAKNIEVENDPYVPWVFSAAHTTETGFAYMASNSGELGYYGKAVSSLKFTVTGAGLLDFDFKLQSGGNYWLVWGEQPLSITDSIGQAYTGTHASDKDNNGERFWRINSDDNTDVNRLIAAGCTSTKTVSNNNYMFWLVGGEKWEGNKTTTMLEDGWAHVSIPMGAEGQKKTYYVSYFTSGEYYGYSTPWNGATPASFALIRNVGFFSGEGTLTYSVSNGEAGSVSATSGGKGVESGNPIALGSRVTFKATVNGGNQFYGWVNPNGKLLSTAEEYTTSVTDAQFTVQAIIEPEGKYSVRNDGKFYEDLKSAIDAAQADDKLIVIKDGLTVSESMELPAKVSLVLPVNDRGDDYELGTKTNSTPRVPWSSEELIGKYKNFTLTVLEGQTFTIKGSLFIGAVEHYPDQNAQGATSGKYNVLDIQGGVVVDEGGHLDVRGLVTGKGGITVKKGGKLTQPFMILDYNGGTNTEASFNEGVTPFKMYAMVNVQCAGGYTVEFGGEVWGHASLYFWSSTTTIDTPFITWDGAEGDSATALLILKEGARATSKYDDKQKRVTGIDNVADVGKTTITVEGGAKAGYMQFPLGINTAGVYFSLPYNYELILTKAESAPDCTYDLENNFKLMPGSIVRVEKGATLNIVSGKGLHVYDSFFIPPVAKRTYPTGEQLETAGYKSYASLIVNGTLNIQNGATFLGTVQTTNADGTAQIVVGKNVTLSAKLFDGVATQYSCNYTEYTLKAQIWAKTGAETGELHALEAGATYVSTAAEKFTLAGIEFKYCMGGKAGDEHHHDDSHNYSEQNKKTADVLASQENAPTGSWMLVHGDAHVYDWTPNDGEKPTAEDPVKTLTRGCTVVGCTHEDHRTLLYNFGTLTSQEYKGKEFTADDLAALFKALYASSDGAKLDGVKVTCNPSETVKAAKDYTVTVTLEGAWFLGERDTFEASASFTLKITPKALAVTVEDQEAVYSGGEPTVSQSKWTADGLFEGDTLGISIEKAAGVKADKYDLTAKALEGAQYANKNYTITFQYTNREHSVFEIKKAKLTVTPNPVSSPEGEEPIPTSEFTAAVSGFVNEAERSQLEKGILEKLTFTCEVTKDSTKGSYDITVEYTGTLDNYDVDCTAKGHYTVTDPLFTGVRFKDTSPVTYDGKAHALEVTGHEGLTEVNVVITYQREGQPVEPANVKNAGTYSVTAVITAKDANGQIYSQELTAQFTIEKLTVTVELLPQGKTYDGSAAVASSEQGKDWKLAEGSKLGEGDDFGVLGVSIKVTSPTKNAGDYVLFASAEPNENYTVEFSNNNQKLYTIRARDLHITVTPVTTVYGEATDLDQSGWTFDDESELVDGDTVHIVLTAGTIKDADVYDITGAKDGDKGDNGNYTFHITDAKWTVAPKPVTVGIENQSATYDYRKNYTLDQTKWHIEGGEEALAYGEKKDVLKVTLSAAGLADVGTYAITGAWDNGNYAVTFKGEYAAEDADQGKAGVYTIGKRDITDDEGLIFMLTVDAESTAEGVDGLRTSYAGKALTFSANVSFLEGETPKELHAVMDPAQVNAIGTFTVTATIEDKNYSGSKVFTVIVTNADGYTEELIAKLEELKEHAEGISADALKADDFDDLKEIKTILDGLTEDEREAAAEALEKYEALVEAWEDLADIDSIVETAQEIADAPIAGLLEAAAALTALAGLAYIALKGGIL